MIVTQMACTHSANHTAQLTRYRGCCKTMSRYSWDAKELAPSFVYTKKLVASFSNIVF
jgi:hypothetical protein